MVKSFLIVECQFLLLFFLVIKARNSVYHVKSICNKKGYWKVLKQRTYISTNIWLPIYQVFCKVFGRLYFLALDLRLLITPLVSTKISYLHINFFTFAKSFFFHILNYRVDQSIFCFFQIVHKRLAARNILLNFLLEPKITGFGPDPASVEDNDSTSVSHDNSTNLRWSHKPVSHRYILVPSQHHKSWSFFCA